jgi:hypothetical protein
MKENNTETIELKYKTRESVQEAIEKEQNKKYLLCKKHSWLDYGTYKMCSKCIFKVTYTDEEIHLMKEAARRLEEEKEKKHQECLKKSEENYKKNLEEYETKIANCKAHDYEFNGVPGQSRAYVCTKCNHHKEIKDGY